MTDDRGRWMATMVACSALVGCGDGAITANEIRQSIVYGIDSRVDYFETADPSLRARMSQSTVAFIANRWLDIPRAQVSPDAPSWASVGRLCPGEPFAEQPAAAFCTGVLLDWDLVLTAGHCVRSLGLHEFSVVFGYHYESEGELSMLPGDVVSPTEIIDEALTPSNAEVRLDYAWVRLGQPAPTGRRPAPMYRHPPLLAAGDPVATIGAANGLPLKLDASGTVRDVRPSSDYFVANTDTSGGWSGGGAFDSQHALVGSLARGGPDLVTTAAGCTATVHARDSEAEEQFTYAYRAVERLCATDPTASSLCRTECDEPCEALPPLTIDAGCAISAAPSGRRPATTGLAFAFGLMCIATIRNRQRVARLKRSR